MALGSTQPVREMSTRNLPGDERRPADKADNLTAICEPIVWKMWVPRRLTILWASTACYRGIWTFFRDNVTFSIVYFKLDTSCLAHIAFACPLNGRTFV
jgi:hypothetical protein